MRVPLPHRASRCPLAVVVAAVGLAALPSLAADEHLRLGVLAVEGDALPFDVRARIEDDARALDRFDVQDSAAVDRVVADVHKAGVVCSVSTVTACVKLAINAGFDLVIVSSVIRGDDGEVFTLRLVDARYGASHVGGRVVQDAADVDAAVAALFNPARPASATLPAPAKPPAPAAPPPSAPPPAAPVPRAGHGQAFLAGTLAGVAGVAALGCGAAAGVYEAQAGATLAAWQGGAPVDGAELEGVEAAEEAFGACAVVAGALAVAGGVAAFALAE